MKDDRIVASGPHINGTAKETQNFPDCLLLPGLVDMRAHPAPGSSKYGHRPARRVTAQMHDHRAVSGRRRGRPLAGAPPHDSSWF